MRNDQYKPLAAFGSAAPEQLNKTDAPLTPLDVLSVHEQRRRRSLLRIISLGVLIPVVILIPTALIPTLDKVTLIALLLALSGTLAALLLNQAQQVSAGSFALLAGLTAAVAWEIIGKAQAQHGVDLSDLRLYDLFILPIVVSAVLVGRRGPIIFGAASALFTISSLLLLQHTPELQLYWTGHYKDAILGSVYDVIAVPIAIQLLAATAAWLGADSVRRALLEASRADDLATANGQIQAQTQSLEMQRYRLQQGIGQIQTVHAAVARGQWDARVSITDGELLPVALSLNLLLDRISRMTRESEQRARVDAASHDLAIALRRLRAGEPYNPPNYTGTPFDEVLVELARLRSIPAPNTSRTTGYDLGGPSIPPRSLPAPASQPERPFPFGPATSAAPRFDLGMSRETLPPPAARFDPAAFANPPSNISGLGMNAALDSMLQPGRMSLPPLNTQQPPVDPAFNAPNPQGFNASTIAPPTGPLPTGPLAPPINPRSPLPTVPRSAFGPSRPNPGGQDWPDLDASPTPERGPVSTALPAWLQAQATSAVPSESTPLSASDLIQPADLPPWLRETAGTENQPTEPEQRADDDDPAAPNDLPPWLKNIP